MDNQRISIQSTSDRRQSGTGKSDSVAGQGIQGRDVEVKKSVAKNTEKKITDLALEGYQNTVDYYQKELNFMAPKKKDNNNRSEDKLSNSWVTCVDEDGRLYCRPLTITEEESMRKRLGRQEISIGEDSSC